MYYHILIDEILWTISFMLNRNGGKKYVIYGHFEILANSLANSVYKTLSYYKVDLSILRACSLHHHR